MPLPRIARYLAIPAQPAPAIFIVIFSVLMMIATLAGLLGIWLGILLFFGFIRYSFALLESVSESKRDQPVLTIEMLNPIGEMRSIIILVLVSAVFFATDAATYWMPPIIRILLGLVVLVFLLAIVTVQAATGSIKQAVNPRLIIELIRRLGRDYVLIFVCALVLYLVGCWIAGLAALPLIVRLALLMYGWLAIFALIGGVIRERHDDLGIEDAELDVVELNKTAAIELQRNHQVDQIYAEWRSGAHKNAWQTVTRHLESSADPIAELRWMHERIQRWPDQRLAHRLSQQMLSHLLTAKREGEVLSWISMSLHTNPDFHPLTDAEFIRSIELARNAGDRPIARALLKNFPRFRPNETLPPHLEQLRQELER